MPKKIPSEKSLPPHKAHNENRLDTFVQLLDKARALIDGKKWNEALTVLDEAEKIYPEGPVDHNISLLRANIAYGQKNDADALDYYEQALTKVDNDLKKYSKSFGLRHVKFQIYLGKLRVMTHDGTICQKDTVDQAERMLGEATKLFSFLSNYSGKVDWQAEEINAESAQLKAITEFIGTCK